MICSSAVRLLTLAAARLSNDSAIAKKRGVFARGKLDRISRKLAEYNFCVETDRREWPESTASAGVAQLVERDVPNVNVEGSNPFARLNENAPQLFKCRPAGDRVYFPEPADPALAADTVRINTHWFFTVNVIVPALVFSELSGGCLPA